MIRLGYGLPYKGSKNSIAILFVSEYYIAEPFVQIAENKKTVLCNSNGTNGYAIENRLTK